MQRIGCFPHKKHHAFIFFVPGAFRNVADFFVKSFWWTTVYVKWNRKDSFWNQKRSLTWYLTILLPMHWHFRDEAKDAFHPPCVHMHTFVKVPGSSIQRNDTFQRDHANIVLCSFISIRFRRPRTALIYIGFRQCIDVLEMRHVSCRLHICGLQHIP